jgi:hypothetical protein
MLKVNQRDGFAFWFLLPISILAEPDVLEQHALEIL